MALNSLLPETANGLEVVWQVVGLIGAVPWIWVFFNAVLDRIAIGIVPSSTRTRIVSDTEITVSFLGTLGSLMFNIAGFGAVITPNARSVGEMTFWQIVIIVAIILSEVFFSLMGLVWAIGLRRYFTYRPTPGQDDYKGPLRRATDRPIEISND